MNLLNQIFNYIVVFPISLLWNLSHFVVTYDLIQNSTTTNISLSKENFAFNSYISSSSSSSSYFYHCLPISYLPEVDLSLRDPRLSKINDTFFCLLLIVITTQLVTKLPPDSNFLLEASSTPLYVFLLSYLSLVEAEY